MHENADQQSTQTTLLPKLVNASSQETTLPFPPSLPQPSRHMSTKARRARLRAQKIAREIAVLHSMTQRLRQKHAKLIRGSLGDRERHCGIALRIVLLEADGANLDDGDLELVLDEDIARHRDAAVRSSILE
ncbi:hypothetical protein M413DRAFT_24883 [Hebeloma cylindrosporum]|nr:hypothetical protein M413DRAFT_24883 [Hebeloma cylindrosporum h7]